MVASSPRFMCALGFRDSSVVLHGQDRTKVSCGMDLASSHGLLLWLETHRYIIVR